MGMPVDITEERMRAFFVWYGQVEDVSAIISKAGITSGEFVLQETMTRKSLSEIPNILMCRKKGCVWLTLLLVMWCLGAQRTPVKTRRHKLTQQQQQRKRRKGLIRPPTTTVFGTRWRGGDGRRQNPPTRRMSNYSGQTRKNNNLSIKLNTN